MKKQTKVLLGLGALAVVDTVIPVPITVVVLVYVLLNKPTWFKELVADIYR